MFLTLICLACIGGDATRVKQRFVSDSLGAIPATRFAAIARYASRARAPVMKELGQLPFKFVKAGSTELSQAVKPTAFAAEQGKLYNQLNANKSAWMSSIVQSPSPHQLLTQYFNKFATSVRLPMSQMSVLGRGVPEESAQLLQLRRNLARSTLDTFFASLSAKDVDQALPRAFVSNLGVISLSAGQAVMKHQGFAIVKFANGKYRVLQGYETSEPRFDLNTMLDSSIAFDKVLGDDELHRLEYSLRSLVEFGAQVNSAHGQVLQDAIYGLGRVDLLDKQVGVSLTCVELNANSSPGGPNLPSERVDAETLVAKMWKQSNMVVVNDDF